MSRSVLKKSTIATVLYRSIFNCTYNKQFYFNWLIKSPKTKHESKSFTLFNQEIESLPNNLKQKITKDISLNFNDHYQSKLKIAQKFVKYLSTIPSIEMIAITGSVATFQPKSTDDIDLMIISQPKSLWTTRLLVILILEIFKIRRRPQDLQFKDKFCTNLFLDSDNLKIPANKQNLYVAHELLHAIPIFHRNQTYHKYLSQNQWAKHFLPRAFDLQFQQTIISPKNLLAFFNPLIKLIEPLIHKLSIKYMSSSKGSEIINRNQAFFHPHDYQTEIELAFQKALVSYKIDYHEFFFIDQKPKRSSRGQTNSS